MNEHPWDILGWILLASIVIPFAIIAAGFIVTLTHAIYEDARTQRKRKRADKGKLICESKKGCTNIATRRGLGGYPCEDHVNELSSKRTFSGHASYAPLLEWYKKEQDQAK